MIRAVIALTGIAWVVESFPTIALPSRRISLAGKYAFIQGDVDSRRYLQGATHVASTTSSSALEYDIDSWSKVRDGTSSGVRFSVAAFERPVASFMIMRQVPSRDCAGGMYNNISKTE